MAAKIFTCDCRGVAAVQLLSSVDQALLSVPTSAPARPFVQVAWDQWQLQGPARPDNELFFNNDRGERVPLPGYAFDAFSNYRQQQAGVGRTFSSQGTVQLLCAAGTAADGEFSSLLLGFSDNPPVPGWLTDASEILVHETVKKVALQLRNTIFTDQRGPILQMTSGGWAHQMFINFGKSF